ncbi:hypothetical protein [Alkalicoccus urumqiensis]|uniref:Uncharacterized protein n=1 Tax=Alkalicoccus urumqiensis TaxID=1548213 RepID=A0A2P6MDU1_ALKUR|nr:hypothetical protein [Alkalicoccus urumqiensis]PRO64443.1 hypothetical protein C6I21_14685 [Alkalicoccus urumqiensis]
MQKEALLYTTQAVPRNAEGRDCFRIHASASADCVRLTPASLEHLFTKYTRVTLVIPGSTSDEVQQGTLSARDAFLYELLTVWADACQCEFQMMTASDSTQTMSSGCVTSVQTWLAGSGPDIHKTARSYFSFLTLFSKGLIQTKRSKTTVTITLLGLPLIELKEEKNLPASLSCWAVTGGILTSKEKRSRGKFWFIKSTIYPELYYAGLTHYRPRLPFRLYKWTQSILHAWTVKRFAARYAATLRCRR